MSKNTRRPIWQWILFSAILTGMIATFFLYFVLGQDNPYSSQDIPHIRRQTLPLHGTLNLPLLERNNSKESGKLLLKETHGQLSIIILLNERPLEIAQPAQMHTGSCQQIGPVKYQLNPVINKKSTTILQVNLAKLKEQLPLSLIILKSKDDTMTVTCSDVRLE